MTVRVAISLLAGRGASILVVPRANPAGEPNPNPPAAPFNVLPGDEPREFVVDDPESFIVSELIGAALETERNSRSAADRRKREDAERAADHQALGHDKVQTKNDEGLGPHEGESDEDYHQRIDAANRGEGPAGEGE